MRVRASRKSRHVGDSRCYRIRDGDIEQLTRDHSLIGDALAWNPNLTREELSRLPKNIISRALGLRRAVQVDLRSERGLPGDIYILCSDGLSGMVNDERILYTMLLTEDLDEACELLIALANDAGGNDNITAVAVRLMSDPRRASPDIEAAPIPIDEVLVMLDEEELTADDIPDSDTDPGGAPASAVLAKCAACGSSASSSDAFCGQCGARIAPDA